jgi:CheY-like chemotaxis protein
VKDQGIGLTPEMQQRVFDLFVQNRQSIDRSQGGLGLGLAIVRSLVLLHGGTVRATSEGEGSGSEFIVELPRAAGDVWPARPSGSTATASRHVRKADHPQRILVVDDNEDAATLLSEALVSLGYVVRTAANGPAALRMAEEFSPHVALLDIGLPVMDGYELAERLRATDTRSGLRLIAVTGYGQSEDKLRSQAAGFEIHLVKPLALDQLQRVFERVNDASSGESH